MPKAGSLILRTTVTEMRRDARRPAVGCSSSTRSATRRPTRHEQRQRDVLRRAAARTAAQGRIHRSRRGSARERMTALAGAGATARAARGAQVILAYSPRAMILSRGHPRGAVRFGPDQADGPPSAGLARPADSWLPRTRRRRLALTARRSGAALRDARRAEHLAGRVGHDRARPTAGSGDALAPALQRVDAAAVLRARMGLDARLFGAGPLGFRSFSALAGVLTVPVLYAAGRQISVARRAVGGRARSRQPCHVLLLPGGARLCAR